MAAKNRTRRRAQVQTEAEQGAGAGDGEEAVGKGWEAIMTISEITKQPHLAECVFHIRNAQRELSMAGFGHSSTYYRLTRARMAVERRLTNPHLEGCVCSRCLMSLMKACAKRYKNGGKR